MMYLIHGKNVCRCHNVPLPSTTTKRKKMKLQSPDSGLVPLLPEVGAGQVCIPSEHHLPNF
jgi:hypothetical protein